MPKRSIEIAAGAFVLALGAAALLLWPDRPPSIDPNDPDRVALGRAIYEARCASCHGDRLQGQPNWWERLPTGRLPAPPHDESGHTWHHPDSVLIAITKHGLKPPYAPPDHESDMPGFGDVLTDEEVRAVLAFIKSAWPPSIQERQQQISRRAER